MSLSEYFPVFSKLTSKQQEQLLKQSVIQTIPRGTLLHGGADDCTGLVLIRFGQLRVFIISEEGREITLYRLFDRDICLFSASCMISSIQFDITITAEKETQAFIIPSDFYRSLMEESVAVSNYTNQLMAARFTDVMWLMEQIMWKSFDKRLAHFLLEEAKIEDSSILKLTHEGIAAHLGTAREVVTRMLKYFQTEGMVRLSRGVIEITDHENGETKRGIKNLPRLVSLIFPFRMDKQIRRPYGQR